MAGPIKENQGMTRFGKLLLVGVLASTLGLIGCSDDNGDGGAGGSAGTGGTAGDGGTGGDELTCPQDGNASDMCGAGEEIDDTYTASQGSVTCDGLGVIEVPIDIVLAAKSGTPDGPTEVETRVQLILDQVTVEELGQLVQTAVIGQASGIVDQVGSSDDPLQVCATAPCTVDFEMADQDVIVTTPATTGLWTAVDGSIEVEVTDITFAIETPVPLLLSTAGSDPACTWDLKPSVTLPPPAP
jgi:hypothetical protein